MMKSIPLNRGLVALVDDADYASLARFKWRAWWNKSNRAFYAVRDSLRSGRKERVWMHREILGLRLHDPRRGDHREPSETLNNQRSNLRISTAAQNNANSRLRSDSTSGFKGVCFDKWSGRYIASIRVNGKHKNLGRFDTPELAHEAYRAAATLHRGEFARFS